MTVEIHVAAKLLRGAVMAPRITSIIISHPQIFVDGYLRHSAERFDGVMVDELEVTIAS